MADIKLTRDGQGGYTYADGRFTIEPCIIGEGVNNNGGWSPGKKNWHVIDHQGQRFKRLGRLVNETTEDTLSDARDRIASVLRSEQEN